MDVADCVIIGRDEWFKKMNDSKIREGKTQAAKMTCVFCMINSGIETVYNASKNDTINS